MIMFLIYNSLYIKNIMMKLNPKKVSLEDAFPELAKQWHSTKNGDLKPSEVSYGSNEKVWWICDKSICKHSHEWHATIGSRTGKGGHGCPYCSGRKCCECNSFGKNFPEIAKQWHPTKNGDLKPAEFAKQSSQKVWWLCDKSTCKHPHEWQAPISSRSGKQKNGCPYCYGRRYCECNSFGKQYPELVKEWHPIKNGKLIPTNISKSSSDIVWWLCDKSTCEHPHEWQTSIGDRSGKQNTGCPHCAGQKYCECNSFGKKYPEIAKQWHPTKNKKLKPNKFSQHSAHKIWWLCDKSTCGCPHEWKSSISHRTSDKSTHCPYCSHGQKFCECNSFGKKYPEIATQWHPTKNNTLRSIDVSPISGKKVWWLCDKSTCEHPHEWQTYIYSRTGKKNTGCPHCAGQKYCECNSFGTKYPEIATQWHPTKNDDLKPTEHAKHAKKKVWWLCDKSSCIHPHEWQANIYSRTGKDKSGCPHCAGQKYCKCKVCPSCQLFNTGGGLCDYCKPAATNKKFLKTKEMKVVKYLSDNIQDYSFIHNKSVGSECTDGHLFPDIRYDCITYQLIVEVDEHKHRGADYNCDERRMYDIIAKLGQPCIFIRYNPDSKKSNLTELVKNINSYLEPELDEIKLKWNEFGFAVNYMFY
jgi:hypothetical protein